MGQIVTAPLKITACRHRVPLVDTRGSVGGVRCNRGIFVNIGGPQVHGHSLEKPVEQAYRYRSVTVAARLGVVRRNRGFSLSLVGRRAHGHSLAVAARLGAIPIHERTSELVYSAGHSGSVDQLLNELSGGLFFTALEECERFGIDDAVPQLAAGGEISNARADLRAGLL